MTTREELKTEIEKINNLKVPLNMKKQTINFMIKGYNLGRKESLEELKKLNIWQPECKFICVNSQELNNTKADLSEVKNNE